MSKVYIKNGCVVVSAAVDDVLRLLPEAAIRAKRRKPDGRTVYDCLCPLHDDNSPSLFIAPLSHLNATAIKCLAGCDLDSLAAYFSRALVLESKGASTRQRSIVHVNTDDLLDVASRYMNGRRPDHVYVYSDSFVVCRWNMEDGGKVVRPFSRDNNGVWHPTNRYASTPRPLFKSSNDNNWKNCLVVEGEKAVEYFEKEISPHLSNPGDWLCVTSSGGAAAARFSDWASIARSDRHYFLWPDNDETGFKYIGDVCDLLKSSGARHIHIIDPSKAAAEIGIGEIGPGWDIADCQNAASLASYLEGLASVYDDSLHLAWRCLVDVRDEQIDWVWNLVVPAGALTIFFGQPGVGKSYMTCELAARLSSGRGFMPFTHEEHRTACDVVLIALEDHIGSVVKRRIVGCGGDISRIYVLEGIKDPISDAIIPLRLADEAHVAAIDGLLKKLPNPGLLIVDPLSEALGVTDVYSETLVRQGFHALRRLIARYPRLAVVGVMHDIKQKQQNRHVAFSYRQLDTLINSRAFSALARSVVHFSLVNDTPLRVMNVLKSSWGRRPPPAFWCLRPSYEVANHVAVQWLGTTRASLLDINLDNWRQMIEFFRPEWSSVEILVDEEA